MSTCRLIEQEIVSLLEPLQHKVFNFTSSRPSKQDDSFNGLSLSKTALPKDSDVPEEDATWASLYRNGSQANRPAHEHPLRILHQIKRQTKNLLLQFFLFALLAAQETFADSFPLREFKDFINNKPTIKDFSFRLSTRLDQWNSIDPSTYRIFKFTYQKDHAFFLIEHRHTYQKYGTMVLFWYPQDDEGSQTHTDSSPDRLFIVTPG